MDVCGEVVKIGHKVQKFKVGDIVYGFATGSLSEYCLVEEAKVAIKPAKVLHRHRVRDRRSVFINFAQATASAAASLPVVALTSYQVP